jgi:hypothetical protein
MRDKKKCRPSGKGRQNATLRLQIPIGSSVLAVMFGVMTAGLDVMMFGMAGMTVSAVGVVRGLFVIAGFMMLGRFAMMLGGVLVMLGSLVMVLDACVVAHVCSPGSQCENALRVYAIRLTMG